MTRQRRKTGAPEARPRPPDVVISRALPEALIARLGPRHAVMPEPGSEYTHAEIAALANHALALIVTPTVPVDEPLLASAPRVQIVANAGVGYDNIDVVAAERLGILVTNTPDVVTDATADIALLLVLATLRRAAEGFELVRHGGWNGPVTEALWGSDPRDRVLGIVGMGRIGRAVARRVGVLGMSVVYRNRTRLDAEIEADLGATWVSLNELLRRADVISIHVPLTSSTRGMIGRSEFAAMKPGAVFINTARGPIVDQGALVEALESRHLSAVGLDVYEDEPFVPLALRLHPRAFLLPHIGTATFDTRHAMFKLAIDNVAEVLAGRPPLTPVAAATGRP